MELVVGGVVFLVTSRSAPTIHPTHLRHYPTCKRPPEFSGAAVRLGAVARTGGAGFKPLCPRLARRPHALARCAAGHLGGTAYCAMPTGRPCCGVPGLLCGRVGQGAGACCPPPGSGHGLPLVLFRVTAWHEGCRPRPYCGRPASRTGPRAEGSLLAVKRVRLVATRKAGCQGGRGALETVRVLSLHGGCHTLLVFCVAANMQQRHLVW